jgi:histidine triad (HIT) family protein
MSTIFTKIIQWDIPSYKIYENTHVFAFLDIHPIQPWHTLIVPKIEVDYFVDVPEPFYSEVFNSAKVLAPVLTMVTWKQRVATQIIGVDVPHFHYHLIPIDNVTDMHQKWVTANPDQLLYVQQQIQIALSS